MKLATIPCALAKVLVGLADLKWRVPQRVVGLRIVAVALALALLPSQSSFANGWPPFGAWAYGSGWSTPGVSRYRSVYRTGFRGNSFAFHRASYRSFGRVGWWPSYSPYRSVSHRYISYRYRPAPLYTAVHLYPRYYRYSLYPSYTTYYGCPTLALPAVPIVYPTWQCNVSPWLLSQTSVTTPIITQNPSIAPTFAVNAKAPTGPVQNQTPAGLNTTQVLSKVSAVQGVPADLLAAADAIFQATGFKEAGVAYAQLSVRYGSTPELLTRRFACHVLNHDFGQAEVVASLASVMNVSMSANLLGEANQASIAVNKRNRYSELLAKRALEDNQDAMALLSVGTWLALTDQPERAQLFIAASKQPKTTSPVPDVQPAADTGLFVARSPIQ